MGFSMVYPENLLEVNQLFLTIATFELLPADKLAHSLFTLSPHSEEDIQLSMENLGLDSQNFLINGGTLLLMFLIWAVLAFIATVLDLISKYLLTKFEKFGKFTSWLIV